MDNQSLLFSSPQVKVNDVRGNKDYTTTGWLASEEELEQATTSNGNGSSSGDASFKPGEMGGRIRKTVCNSFGMGLKFRTEEVQRCREAQDGERYVVEVC